MAGRALEFYAYRPIPDRLYMIRRGWLVRVYGTFSGMRTALAQAVEFGPDTDTYGVAGEPIEVYEITLDNDSMRRIDLQDQA